MGDSTRGLSNMYPRAATLANVFDAQHATARVVEGHTRGLKNQYERLVKVETGLEVLEVDNVKIHKDLTEIKTTLKVGFGAVTIAIALAGLLIAMSNKRESGPALLPPPPVATVQAQPTRP